MEELNLGRVVGPKGDPGPNGFSPTITENTENNETVYKLDITTANASFTTPNLKGPKGDTPEASVTSFKGRTGNIEPESGDYTAKMVGAVSTQGDTMTGLLNAYGGISLDVSTEQEDLHFILGIKAFSEGGNVIWQEALQTIVGKAKAAEKLEKNAGSKDNPVYFSNGVPVACSFSKETVDASIQEAILDSWGASY